MQALYHRLTTTKPDMIYILTNVAVTVTKPVPLSGTFFFGNYRPKGQGHFYEKKIPTELS